MFLGLHLVTFTFVPDIFSIVLAENANPLMTLNFAGHSCTDEEPSVSLFSHQN